MQKESQIPGLNESNQGLTALFSGLSHFFTSLFPTRETKPEPLETFKRLLEMADDIDKKNPFGLPSLIFAILRPLQSEQILSVAERTIHCARADISTDTFFANHFPFSLFDDNYCRKLEPSRFRLDLRRHPVLTTPWHRVNFACALAAIGTGKANGPWKQDSRNHSVALLLPWGIGIVDGGNHSIAAGILAGEGEIVPYHVFDFSPLLELVRCDGTHLIENSTGKKVTEIQNQRIAAVFEIGRTMMAHGELLYPLAPHIEGKEQSK